MDKSEQKLMSTVESLAPEILDFTSRMVACPSTLGREGPVLDVMEKELGRLKLDPVRVEISPQDLADHPGFAPVPWDYEGRYNITGTRPADADGGKSALFNGHLDVVSPEPLARWNKDPFVPVVEDGWLYGRGAGDMKAGVAAMTYALHAVDKAGMGLRAPVTIEAVIEEECSGNGALACRNAGIDAEAVLIPEPFGPTILTSQVGVAWFKVLLSGVPVHVLEARSGVNAIEKCHPLFMALRGLEEEMNGTVHPAFAGLEHPVNLNIGIIKGGDWPSTVPAEAEFHCRIGFFPGVSFESIRKQVIQCIEGAAENDPWLAKNPPKLYFYGFRSEGHTVDSNQPVFRILSDCQMSLTGRPAKEFVSTATTDLRSFVHFGNGQATCFGPIAENIHGDNERVHIASVIHTAKAYALFLARWCRIID
jgi:acetylornithine deacetylase